MRMAAIVFAALPLAAQQPVTGPVVAPPELMPAIAVPNVPSTPEAALPAAPATVAVAVTLTTPPDTVSLASTV